MSTDRELLELAAKAAHLDTHWGGGWQADMMFRALPRPNSPLTANVEWNPIADDGDALRLAVKLGLRVSCEWTTTTVYTPTGNRYCWNGAAIVEGNDPYAATRRAVVRAAAEIGKAMP